jgi:putative oxidoreductase
MTLADLSLLLLRLVVGLTFAAHGAQKAFGWWNGSGFAAWQQAMTRMRFRPAPVWAIASIAAELLGGLLMAAGLVTPFAAAALVAQSVVIVLKAHLPNGFWNGQRGYEYPLIIGAAVVAVLGIGPGRLSVDAAIGLALATPALWALLGLGLVAGLASYGISQLEPPAEAVAQQR